MPVSRPHRHFTRLLVALLALASTSAVADEHRVADLDPSRTYDVLVEGSVVHTGLAPGAYGFIIFEVPPGRLQVVASGQGDLTPPDAITDLSAAPGEPGTAVLSWSAPADQGLETDRYEIRWATSIASLDSSPTLDPEAPDPSAPGSSESHVVDGLPGGQLVYFAILARDSAGNWSAASNVASATIDEADSGSGGPDGDIVPPDTVTDLELEKTSARKVTLTWTASGDDGSIGRAAAYDLRYAAVPLTAANFERGTRAVVGAPADPGVREQFEIAPLDRNTTYFFALRVEDDAGNASLPTPSLFVQTRPFEDSPLAPGAEVSARVVHGGVLLEWVASIDPEVSGYNVYRLGSEPAAPETRLTPSPTSELSFLDESVDEGQGYTYRVTSVDEAGNESVDAASTWVRASSVPPVAMIEKIYPNPVRPGESTVFRIGIPEVGPGNPDGARVTVDLYDVAGRRIARVFDDLVLPGVREVRWQSDAGGRSLVPGLYVALVKAAGTSVRGRLAVAR